MKKNRIKEICEYAFYLGKGLALCLYIVTLGIVCLFSIVFLAIRGQNRACGQ